MSGRLFARLAALMPSHRFSARFPRPLARFVLAAAGSAAVLASPALEAREVVDRILVHVNSRVVTKSHFDARVEQALADAAAPRDVAGLETLKKQVLEELVNEALLEDRARDLDLFTTEADVDDQVARLKEQNKVQTEEEFEKALAASGLTIDRLRDQIRKTLTVQRVVGREVNSKVDLSDDALRAIYEREKEAWRISEQVRIAEILIATGDDASSRASAERRAREASDKLKGGLKFDTAVSLFSDGPTRQRGGDLGFVAPGELAAELDRVAFSLGVDAVSEPVLTKNGWHILKVVEKKPVSYKPFGDVKADLLKREQETQFQKKLAEYLEKLKRDAVFRVSADASPYYAAPPAVTPAPPAAKSEKKAPPKG